MIHPSVNAIIPYSRHFPILLYPSDRQMIHGRIRGLLSTIIPRLKRYRNLFLIIFPARSIESPHKRPAPLRRERAGPSTNRSCQFPLPFGAFSSIPLIVFFARYMILPLSRPDVTPLTGPPKQISYCSAAGRPPNSNTNALTRK